MRPQQMDRLEFHMFTLNIADNILRLRHNKKITQEQLADFVGVTKASVSKWETGQSTPDIIILPQLATFFDITVDELMGYKPQLSKEQIQKFYQDFAADFANGLFEETMAKTKSYVKQYYSCYPFLFQICVLWFNHFILEEKEKQTELLTSISELCEHIKNNCKDVGVCSDAIVFQAIVHLQMGRFQEVIDALEETTKPYNLLRSSGTIMSMAYTMMGNINMAESYIQINMYLNLLSLVAYAGQYLSIHGDDLEICEETIIRLEKVIDAYELAKLHPNDIGGFEYQAAICYATHGKKEEALKHAHKYAFTITDLVSKDILSLHGDDYFNRIEEWFEKTNSTTNAPRDRKLVLEDIKRSFGHPAFTILEGEPEFEILKNKLEGLV